MTVAAVAEVVVEQIKSRYCPLSKV